MDQFVYPVLFEEDEDEVIGRVASFPEVLTSGRNRAEALVQVEDALEEAILSRLANGEDIPLPDRNLARQDTVLLSPLTAVRVLVEAKRRERGWTRTQLAAEMGKDEKVVRRILDGRTGVAMGTALQALRALGFSATLAWR